MDGHSSARSPFFLIRRQPGFTLVELLVVFAILGVLVSLVLPDVARQFDRAQSSEEVVVFDREMNGLAWKAFIASSSIEVDLAGSEMRWVVSASGEAGRLTFERISFISPLKFHFNSAGYASVDELEFGVGSRRVRYSLNRRFTE
jgi:prepilin-type N-terminal cleavage/methylation domain-containing protein